MFNIDNILTINDFFKYYDKINSPFDKECCFDRVLSILDAHKRGSTCLYLSQEEAEKIATFPNIHNLKPNAFYWVEGEEYNFIYKGHKGIIRKDKE